MSSGKVLSRGQTLGSLNPEQMELIRIEYLDSSAAEYRIGIPYIWLQLTLSQQRLTSDLKPARHNFSLPDSVFISSEPRGLTGHWTR